MALIRTTSRSGSSASSGTASALRTESGTSIARKTRQRSPSSAGMLADLQVDLAGALQRRLSIIDELGEPGRGALRAVKIDGRGQHQDDREVHLVGATLEHGRDHVAAVGGDDAGHRAGGE